MSKPLKAGGEVDSWCTKCKLVLNHRIIAMVAGTPVKVECSTCNSHHNFRARAPGDKAPAAEKKTSGASSASGPRSVRVPSATRAAKEAADRVKTWSQAVNGRAVTDFKPYRVDQLFSEGELIRHKKFGDGFVTRILDARKVEIMFEDETRTLAQGLVD